MLLEAVRHCSKFENISEMEIALAISKWMAQANNRIAKRNNKAVNEKKTL